MGASAVDIADSVTNLIEASLADCGFELVEVQHTGPSIRVLVDDVSGAGLDLERVTVATKVVSGLLDDTDLMPGAYTLEVSSPGLERPLRTPAHFVRFVGREIVVRLRAGADAPRRFEALLESATDDNVVVRELTDGRAGANTRTLAYVEIDRARLVVRWGTPKPGRSAKSRDGVASEASSDLVEHDEHVERDESEDAELLSANELETR